MESSPSEETPRQKLIRSISELGTKAYSPQAPDAGRDQARKELEELIQSTKTTALLPALNLLIRPNYAPEWFRPAVMDFLTALPMRPDGVRPTLEFVFAVHPTGTVRTADATEPQKRGADVTNESLNMATSLLSNAPSSVSTESWFSSVGPQLLQLLDEGDADLRKVVAYVIGFGILGNRKLGSPGTPGWKYLAEPMLNAIKPSPKKYGDILDSDSIIDLSREHVIVAPDELAKALARLQSLLNSHPNAGLCKRLISRILSPLWALASWQQAKSTTKEAYCEPARDLLKTFLRLETSPQVLVLLVQKLNYLGGHEKDKPEWLFQEAVDGRPQIIAVRTIGGTRPGMGQLTLEGLDDKISIFLALLGEASPDTTISSLFIDLFKKWASASSEQKARQSTIVLTAELSDNKRDPMEQLIEVKVLQAMMDKFSEKLADQPMNLLELAAQVLGGSDESDDEVVSVALSLLNMVITVPGFQKGRVKDDVMQPIEAALERLSRSDDDSIGGTARNLGLLLKYRDEIEDPTELPTAPTDRQIEDRKTYRLAISYITQPDSPPPVRSEGLTLISNLITSQSPILDIPGILVLLSSLLKNDEDFVTVKIIKIYTQLANKHPGSVTKELLDHYVDPKEIAALDTRLRFGEALAQVIERLGETFAGTTAEQTGQALLSVAGRRGYRPKTEAKQARDERTRLQQKKEAEEAWGGEVPDMSEPMTAEERAREAVLAQIVEGWESKRGSEDVRMRASALAIMSTALETNLAGLDPVLVSAAVDLAMHILQLEREPEKGIVRRAAVLLVLAFVRALDQARQAGRKLGVGLAAAEDVARVLRYVAQTDNDGLAQQHARDVLDSLEAWEMTRLMPVADAPNAPGGLASIAGLSINPAESVMARDVSRPRIEEIE